MADPDWGQIAKDAGHFLVDHQDEIVDGVSDAAAWVGDAASDAASAVGDFFSGWPEVEAEADPDWGQIAKDAGHWAVDHQDEIMDVAGDVAGGIGDAAAAVGDWFSGWPQAKRFHHH